jgi:alanine racemase
MLMLIGRIFGREYYPLNRILVSQNQLLQNYNLLKSANQSVKIAPVLKSNAYGHGIELVGKVLDSQGAPFLCVDSLYEAYQLKKAGIKSQILIMGYIDPRSLKGKKLPFAYAVFELDFAIALNEIQPGCEVHVFVGTGMSREGVPLQELDKFLKELNKLENLKVMGLMSHLASADNLKSDLNRIQNTNFIKAKKTALKQFPHMKWFHIGGSYALLNKFCEGCNVIRCGKALYGLVEEKFEGLKPVLSLTTQIVQIKKINKGAKVGYSETFVSPKEMVIGILPIGYNDGVDRRLSNKGIVRVGNVECKIVGRISMNVTTIDLSEINDPFVGQEVEIFSDNLKDVNSIENAAKICETIPHELLVHLHPSTRRELI